MTNWELSNCETRVDPLQILVSFNFGVLDD
jgi:hypothetical protein